MNKTNKVLAALVRCEMAESPEELKDAREELRRAYRGYEECRKDPETMITELLMELSAPDQVVGYPYVIKAVLMLLEDPKLINNMTDKFYPAVADSFDTTGHRTERAIRHVVEVIWSRGDYETIDKYFGNMVNPDKGKPTNSEFLARLANIVRLEMKK